MLNQKQQAKLVFAMIIITFNCNCSTSKMGKVKYGENGIVKSGVGITRCDPPQKRYSKDLDVKVKASIDSLITIPISDLDISVQQKVVRLSDYSSEGLDQDLLLFRICQMANNRGFTSEQTQRLIEKALEIWTSRKGTVKVDITNSGINNGIIAGIVSVPEDQEIPLKDNFHIQSNSFPRIRLTKNPECLAIKPRQGTWHNPYIGFPIAEAVLVNGRIEGNNGFTSYTDFHCAVINPKTKLVDSFYVMVLTSLATKEVPLYFSFINKPSCILFGDWNNREKQYHAYY